VISRKLQAGIVILVLAIFAMGFYLVHLKRKAESIATPPVEALAPPPSGPTEQMMLYLASDDDNSLRSLTIASAIPSDSGERGRLALRRLIARYQQPDSPHPLGSGADVREVYLLDPASAVVDLNPEFANGHRSGVEVEQLTVFSLVLSLKAQLPSLSRVRFLVDGKSRETLAGHFDLGGWLDVAMVADAARQQLATDAP
jgi:hypothetical protein